MLNGKKVELNPIGGIMHKLFKLYYIALLGIAIQGCSGMPEDVGCVPIYLGSTFDDEGRYEIIQVEELGCPRIEE
jgi:hypothetical protein